MIWYNLKGEFIVYTFKNYYKKTGMIVTNWNFEIFSFNSFSMSVPFPVKITLIKILLYLVVVLFTKYFSDDLKEHQIFGMINIKSYDPLNWSMCARVNKIHRIFIKIYMILNSNNINTVHHSYYEGMN